MFAIAFRKARSRSFSTSSRRRSVTSIPETSTSDCVRPVTSATGTAVQRERTQLPSAQRSSDSTSSDAPPAAAVAIAADCPAVVVLGDRGPANGVPTSSWSRQPSACRNARFAPTRGLSTSRSRIVPSRSRRTAMLGIASSAVVVASRSRSSSSSRFRRSVMSRPPETMLITLSGCVLHGCGAPVDRAHLAARVREGVLVLAGREVGRERVEPRDHRLALGGLDEEVPEVPPARSPPRRRIRRPRARRR